MEVDFEDFKLKISEYSGVKLYVLLYNKSQSMMRVGNFFIIISLLQFV